MPYDPAEIAHHTAHRATTAAEALAEADIDLTDPDRAVKVGGHRLPIATALHEVAIRVAQGDIAAAECIARDCIDAIAEALAPWAADEAERRERSDRQAARDEAAGERYWRERDDREAA